MLMASKPDALFGQAREDRPRQQDSEGFVAVPGITETFQEASTSFNLDHVDSTATLEWSVDDGLEWNLYEGPVKVEQTTNVLARAIQGNDTSVVVSHRMLKIDHNWQLTLASPPDNQYSAGGSQALIDGLTGGADYRTGEWQGFWGEDCVATIDLGEVERIERIELRAFTKSSHGFGRPAGYWLRI